MESTDITKNYEQVFPHNNADLSGVLIIHAVHSVSYPEPHFQSSGVYMLL